MPKYRETAIPCCHQKEHNWYQPLQAQFDLGGKADHWAPATNSENLSLTPGTGRVEENGHPQLCPLPHWHVHTHAYTINKRFKRRQLDSLRISSDQPLPLCAPRAAAPGMHSFHNKKIQTTVSIGQSNEPRMSSPRVGEGARWSTRAQCPAKAPFLSLQARSPKPLGHHRQHRVRLTSVTVFHL